MFHAIGEVIFDMTNAADENAHLLCSNCFANEGLTGCGKSEDFALLAGVRERIGSARKVFFSLH
jgi:hypothetical protein